MAIGDLSIANNLVYGVFGEPIIFAVVLTMIFLWFSMKYDIPKWGVLSFFIPLGTWVSFHYMPDWAAILLIIFIGVIVGSKYFRATSG